MQQSRHTNCPRRNVSGMIDLSVGRILLSVLLAAVSSDATMAQALASPQPPEEQAAPSPVISPRPATTPVQSDLGLRGFVTPDAPAGQPATNADDRLDLPPSGQRPPASRPVAPVPQRTTEQPATPDVPVVSPLPVPDNAAPTEWSPKLRVMLTLVPDSAGAKSHSSIRYFTGRDTEPSAVNIQPAAVAIRPSYATLACDEISLATAGEDSVEYQFEANSRCRLLLSSLQIDGDSMKLEDGVLTVSNAITTTKDGMKLQAEQMTIPLKPVAISTGMFGQPVSTLKPATLSVVQQKPESTTNGRRQGMFDANRAAQFQPPQFTPAR